MPSTFFPVLLAEQTTTSLLSVRFGLDGQLVRLLVVLVRTALLFLLAVGLFWADSPYNVFCDVQGELPHAGAAKLLHDPGAGDAVAVGIGHDRGGLAMPICSPCNAHPPGSTRTTRSSGNRWFAGGREQRGEEASSHFFLRADDIGMQFSQPMR